MKPTLTDLERLGERTRSKSSPLAFPAIPEELQRFELRRILCGEFLRHLRNLFKASLIVTRHLSSLSQTHSTSHTPVAALPTVRTPHLLLQSFCLHLGSSSLSPTLHLQIIQSTTPSSDPPNTTKHFRHLRTSRVYSAHVPDPLHQHVFLGNPWCI